jgi:hypothetical protein
MPKVMPCGSCRPPSRRLPATPLPGWLSERQKPGWGSGSSTSTLVRRGFPIDAVPVRQALPDLDLVNHHPTRTCGEKIGRRGPTHPDSQPLWDLPIVDQGLHHQARSRPRLDTGCFERPTLYERRRQRRNGRSRICDGLNGEIHPGVQSRGCKITAKPYAAGLRANDRTDYSRGRRCARRR